MNRNSIALIAALACTGAAFAEGPLQDHAPFLMKASRAQVQAELQAFRHAGANPWADDNDQLAAFHGGMSRAQVKAAFIASREAVAAMNGEDSGSSYLARASGADSAQPGTQLARTE